MSDEFAAHPLDASWEWVNPGRRSSYLMNKGRLVLNVSAYIEGECSVALGPHVLRPQLEGDWLIDSHHTETTAEPGWPVQCGILLFADDGSWLMWGPKGLQSMEGTGSLTDNDGNLQTLLQRERMYPFFRIRKRTNEGPHTRYHFYCSDNRVSWESVGVWTDTAGIFANAFVGLMARTENQSYTVEFDYFTNYVPVNEIEEFKSATLDTVWSWEAGNSAYHIIGHPLTEGQLRILSAAGDAMTDNSDRSAKVLKYALHPCFGEWMIETELTSDSANELLARGMLVYADPQNWIAWKLHGEEAARLTGRINGNELDDEVSAEGYYKRLRITKQSDTYELACSTDGLVWMEAGAFRDPGGRLREAKYGMTVSNSGDEAVETGFSLFRESYVPTGAIRGITGLTEIGPITGPGSLGDTERYGVRGTDLGSIVEMDGKHYFMFGDTFSLFDNNATFAVSEEQYWRSNVLGVSEDKDPSKGITLRMITGEDGRAKEVIESHKKLDFNEFTAIPTNGVSYNGILYYSYMNVYHWGEAAHWDCGFSEWCYSEDEGQSWRKSGVRWGASSNFIQLACVKQGSTVFVYGIPSSRWGSVKLAKVAEDAILDQSAYRYFSGTDVQGNPVWSGNVQDAVRIVPGPVGEFSVLYNVWADRWIMTYLNEHTLDIEMREGSQPWGPWSEVPVTLVDHTLPGYDRLVYGPYMTPEFVENDGESIYFTLSKWLPAYNVFWQKAQLLRSR